MDPTFLETTQVLSLHETSLARYGGLPGIRDHGGLESAVAQAQTAYHYGQADVIQIAANYLFHIAKNHAFLDGNKRTAAASAITFLWMHGYDLNPRMNVEMEELTLGIADGSASKEDAVAFFRASC
jgi:death-on-curing protein